MTFVVSALTQHEVIQVSDRRFTYTKPGKPPTYDDEQNKAVLFCGRLMFAFTGIGDLGMGRETDLWLAERICDVIREAGPTPVDQGTLLQGLATKSTEQFRRLRYRGRRHAFIGAGWARFNPTNPEVPARVEEFQPYLALVSNFHDDSARQLDKASDDFSLWVRVLQPDEGGFVLDVPKHLSSDEAKQLTAALAAADGARDPEAMMNIVGGRIRDVAARVDEVGEGLMINCLPRASLAGPPGIMALASGPLAEAQTFLYVPPSGDTTVQLGPVTTCGTGITRNFRAEPIPPGMEIPRPGPTLPTDPPGLIRRWYLAPVVGCGKENDPYRVETLGRGGSPVMPSHEQGHPPAWPSEA
jgi:hypothetical protein